MTKENGKRVSTIRKNFKKSWQLLVLMLPAFIYVLIFHYGPMYGLTIAFKNYRPSLGIWGSSWVGLEHFIRFINSPNFLKMLGNTLSITVYSLATFPLPIIFALLVNEIHNTFFKKTVQMISYMPHFLSGVVVCSLVLMFLSRPNGPINNLIEFLGGTRTAFINIPEYFSSIYVWSGVWQSMGWSSILYLSALSGVSAELGEAARVDGANRLQVMWHVNIPAILPTIVITFIMKIGHLLSLGYSKIFLLQTDLNLSASSVISTYVYKTGIIDGQSSYAAAIGLFNNIINIFILVIANKISRKVTDIGLF